MKMTNLGIMPKHHNCSHAMPECNCDESEKKPRYPELHLSSEALPEIESYDVGDIVTLTFKAKVTGKNTDSYWGDGTHVDLKLMTGGCAPSSSPEDAEPEERDELDEDIEDMKNVKERKLDFDED